MSCDNPTTQIEYRLIEGFPGYSIGSDGSVWTSKRGRWHIDGPRKQMALGRCGNYRAVHLRRDGKPHMRYVHRLVLEVFVGPCPEGMSARHYPDRDVNNCRLENLSWSTLPVNHADKWTHGTMMFGEGHVNAKLTVEAVRIIRAVKHRYRGFYMDMARRFGVSDSTVRDAVRGNTWKHVA